MYIPVAEATFGELPKLSNNGFKMEPPPRPRAPDTQPPKIENTTSFNCWLPSRKMSDLANPLLYFTLRAYSLLRDLVA